MQWLEGDFEESCDFRLFGLTSHAGSHRLCWEMNRLLGWSLAYHMELVPDERAGDVRYVVHRFVSEDTGVDVALIANRLPESQLVSGLPRVDFLLRLGEDTEEVDQIVRTIRGMKLVTLLAEVNPLKTGAFERVAFLDRPEDLRPVSNGLP